MGISNTYTILAVQQVGRHLLDPLDKLVVQCVSIVDQTGPVLQQR